MTTTGRVLAERHDLLHLDADDYYWQDTDPPFQKTNPIEVRWQLLHHKLHRVDNWLISGSMTSWADPFMDLFDLVVFFDVPIDIRIERLRERERREFGARISPGGDMYENHEQFIKWAAQYDQGYLAGRSRERHEKWLRTLQCPVLRIQGDISVKETIGRIEEEMALLRLN